MTTCKAEVSKVLRQGLIRKLHRTLAERPGRDSGLPEISKNARPRTESGPGTHETRGAERTSGPLRRLRGRRDSTSRGFRQRPGLSAGVRSKEKKLRGRSIKAPPLVQQERASNKRGEERKRENVAYRRLASGRALQRLRGTGGRRNRRKERERGSERGLGYDHRIAQHLQRTGEREGVDT